MATDPEEEKKKVLDLLAKVPEKADEQEKIGKTIQESAQQAREIAIPFYEIVSKTPATSIPSSDWAHQVSVLASWHESADKLKSAPAVKAFMATTSAVTSTSTSFVGELCTA